jgi:acyl-CoA thioester hydrolase
MPDQSHRSLEHTLRFKVRSYELDQNGHVNNATYVAWAENVTNEHAEAIGFGRAWSLERGGGWVVRRHEATYHLPAVALDEIEATVRVEGVRGVRGWRRTRIRRVADGALLAEVFSEWAWVRVTDGRPARVPDEIVAAFGAGQTGQEPARQVPA